MSHPDDGLLVDFALGEPVEPTLSGHIDGCPHCAQELHALRSTLDLTRRAAIEDIPWQWPPDALWSRIESALDDEDLAPPRQPSGAQSSGADAADPAGPAPAPPVELDPARRRRARTEGVPSGAASSRSATRAGGRSLASRSGLWLAGVAAASALVGLLAGRAVWAGSPTESVTVASTGMQRLDSTQVVGAAAVRRESGHLDLSLDLDLSAQELPAAGKGYLEVWLINRDGQRMVSVGVLDAAPDTGAASVTVPATFPIAQSLLDAGYVVVDVSSEAFDDDPTHSGDSLARGTLPT